MLLLLLLIIIDVVINYCCHYYYYYSTLAMDGFSKGGCPMFPSTEVLFMFAMHFRRCWDKYQLNICDFHKMNIIFKKKYKTWIKPHYK